jgi:hypothetical protein
MRAAVKKLEGVRREGIGKEEVEGKRRTNSFVLIVDKMVGGKRG